MLETCNNPKEQIIKVCQVNNKSLWSKSLLTANEIKFSVIFYFDIVNLFLHLDWGLTSLLLLTVHSTHLLVYYFGCWFSCYFDYSANEGIGLILV